MGSTRGAAIHLMEERVVVTPLVDPNEHVLETAGKPLKWSKLTKAVEERAPSKLFEESGVPREDLIMATVPEKYLSDADPFVRKR